MPLFRRLAQKTGHAPKWNFNKYLVDPKTREIRHYGSAIRPMNGELEGDIRRLLAR